MVAERHGGSHHHTRTGSRSGPLTANRSGASARTGMMLSKRTIREAGRGGWSWQMRVDLGAAVGPLRPLLKTTRVGRLFHLRWGRSFWAVANNEEDCLLILCPIEVNLLGVMGYERQCRPDRRRTDSPSILPDPQRGQLTDGSYFSARAVATAFVADDRQSVAVLRMNCVAALLRSANPRLHQ